MEPESQIDAYLRSLPAWQHDLATRARAVIHDADPGIAEAWKWGTPVFAHGGNVCAIGAFTDHVKLNFFKGASLPDPAGLFNAGLEAKTTRAIDLRQGDTLDEPAFRALVTEAVAANRKP
jgi:hypothetical protein